VKAVQVISGALRVSGSGSGEDRPLVVLEDLEPACDVRSVILARLKREFEIGAEKRTAKLGNKLFARVAFITPALATEIAIKA
jgi:hypothetical protein